MNEPLFMVPVLHEKIWGGNQLAKQFGYQIPSDKTGEAWGISAHPHGTTTVANGEFAGTKLNDLWQSHPELFANKDNSKPFPLMVKILDANANLSIQVHPDDAYAAEHEGPTELGKTECWYVLSAEPGASIFYGHNAKTKEELAEMIHTGKWDQLLKRKPVKKGDFIYVPSGTIHALAEGVVVLEPQQSSDTTYRLYDFDRVDQKTGKKRTLDLDSAIDVTTVPFEEPEIHPLTVTSDGVEETTFVSTDYFSVKRLRISTESLSQTQAADSFKLVSVTAGSGTLTKAGNVSKLEKGMHFIIPSNFGEYELAGKDLELVETEPGEKVK